MSFLVFNTFKWYLIALILVTYTFFLPVRADFLPFFDPAPVPCFLRMASFALARALDVPRCLTVQIAPFFNRLRIFSRVMESATSSSLSGSNLTLFAPTPSIRAINSLFFLMFTTNYCFTPLLLALLCSRFYLFVVLGFL